MTDEPNEEDEGKKAKKGRSRPKDSAGGSAPQPANPAATAGLASCLTGAILLLIVLGVLGRVLYDRLVDSSLIPPGSLGPGRLALIALLLIVIPIVVYRAVTLWIMGVGPRFVDIEFSWRAGIEALAKQGLSLKSAPMFLIVGAGSDKLRRNLMSAVGGELLVDGVPDVAAPLHWYASEDAIYLYLDNASWMNLAARKYRMASQTRHVGKTAGEPMTGASSGRGRGPIVSTLVPGEAQTPVQPSGPDLLGRTELPGDESRSEDAANNPASPSFGRRRPAKYIGTLSPDVVGPADPLPTKPQAAPSAVRRARPASSEESSLQLRRLESVCTKLRFQRQPVCPLNGILMLLPFDLLQASRKDIEEVERAIAGDLTTAQRELQLRCPVTALVVAMEQERGFCELVRRIGRDHAVRQRFGQRFDIRREPTVDELRKFASYACGVFEDWVYTLFRDDKVLSHPGNPALYNLLCKVRRSFQARLSDVLSKGFGYDPQFGREPILFSGCYFAATGSQPERQAFVSGVLSKLREEQEVLEWTYDALTADSRRRRIALIGWGTAVLLALAIGAFVVFQM